MVAKRVMCHNHKQQTPQPVDCLQHRSFLRSKRLFNRLADHNLYMSCNMAAQANHQTSKVARGQRHPSVPAIDMSLAPISWYGLATIGCEGITKARIAHNREQLRDS
eukprot:1277114-Amphidinium_carterae.2